MARKWVCYKKDGKIIKIVLAGGFGKGNYDSS
jgi:hypothetical protein